MGTASFSSLNSHKYLEHSRKDDLECLANSMVYLRKGYLPWLRNLKITNKMTKRQKYEAVAKKKMETKLSEITSGLPQELQQFYVYCREGMDEVT